MVCDASSKILAAATTSDIPAGLYKSPSRNDMICRFDISNLFYNTLELKTLCNDNILTNYTIVLMNKIVLQDLESTVQNPANMEDW